MHCRSRRPALVSLLVAAWLAGCNVHVFSPPAGGFPLESAAPLGSGKHAVRGDISVGQAVFGPTVSTYRVALARGVTDTLDVSVAPSLIWIHPAEPGNSHSGIYTMRAGVKFAPLRYLALSTGLAPGASAAGAFLAHDAGLTLAAENAYAVPFVSGHALLSLPIAPRSVHIVNDDRDVADDEPSVYRLSPRFTYGFQVGGGLKVPLIHARSPRALPAVACAAAMVGLYDSSQSYGFVTLGCGVDVVF